MRDQLSGDVSLVGGPVQCCWHIEHVSWGISGSGVGGDSLVWAVLRLFSSSNLAQVALFAACCLWCVCILAHSLLRVCLRVCISVLSVSCLVRIQSVMVVCSSTMLRTIFLIISLVVVDAGPESSATALIGRMAATIILNDLQSSSLAFWPLAHVRAVRSASMAIRLHGHHRSWEVLLCVRMSICGMLSTI